MNKELEKVKNIYNLLKLIPQGYHRKQKNGCIVLLEDLLNERIGRIKNNLLTIQQALTPPTEEEVCKALSEWYCKEVVYEDKIFYMVIKKGVLEPISVDDFYECFKYDLLLMLGQFYKSIEEAKK